MVRCTLVYRKRIRSISWYQGGGARQAVCSSTAAIEARHVAPCNTIALCGLARSRRLGCSELLWSPRSGSCHSGRVSDARMDPLLGRHWPFRHSDRRASSTDAAELVFGTGHGIRTSYVLDGLYAQVSSRFRANADAAHVHGRDLSGTLFGGITYLRKRRRSLCLVA